jgi:Bacterial extracellular solute-binding proteins, family 5 Middle
VKVHLDRIAAPTSTSTHHTTVAPWKSEVKNPQAIVVTLDRPRTNLPFPLSLAIGTIESPTAVATYGSNFGSSPETTVGAGPFVMTEWVRNDHMTLKENRNFWDKGKPYLDGLTFEIVADTAQKPIEAYVAEKVDALIAEGLKHPDLASRKKYLNEISQVLLDDAVYSRVFFVAYYNIANAERGWTRHPAIHQGGVPFDLSPLQQGLIDGVRAGFLVNRSGRCSRAPLACTQVRRDIVNPARCRRVPEQNVWTRSRPRSST